MSLIIAFKLFMAYFLIILEYNRLIVYAVFFEFKSYSKRYDLSEFK